MNLKRLRGIAAVALATIAAALFAGCSNSMAGSVDGDNVRMATLTLSATGIPNDYAEQFAKSYPTAATVASRSITPNDPYDIGKLEDSTSQSNGLKFYLSGTSETGKKLDDMQVVISKNATSGKYEYSEANADGTVKGPISIASMSWNLVLTAYKSYTSATVNEPVLRGYCSVDLRNGSGTAEFTLSPENLTTTGTVKITGSFKPYGNVDSYTMGIYRKDSASEKIDERKVEGVTGDGETAVDFTYDSTATTAVPIPPGSYLYKMVFKNAAGVITGSFIDTLIVDAGNDLNQNIGLIDVVNKKPGAPTAFTANLVKGSENPDGTYQVKLSWTSGGGETNFEVQLTEYAKEADGSITEVANSSKIYGMRSMDPATTEETKTVLNFQGSDVWAGEGGAMTYGDTEAYFKLKLGVLYDVQIRARNYVGTSSVSSTEEWTSRVAGTLDADGNEPYGISNDEKINRMKIEYNLNGGTLKYYKETSPGTGSHVDKTVNFTDYKSWKGTDLDLLAITDDPDTNPTAHQLTKGSSPFSKWVDSTGVEVKKSSYTNLSVTADFGSAVTGTVSMGDAKKDVLLKDISVNCASSASGTTPNLTLTKNATYEVAKTMTGAVTKITIQLSPTEAETVYNNIQFELSYNDTQTMLPVTGGGNQCTLSLDDYVAGIIQVRVIADTANATGMSQTLTFRLK